MRILGVDYGLKRIGVAIAETTVKLAFARDPINGTGDAQQDAANLHELCQRESINLVVGGLPLLPSGEMGAQALLTRQFADALVALGLVVEMQDERYTTSAARTNLVHLKRDKQKKLLDSEAARLLLAEYLASLDP